MKNLKIIKTIKYYLNNLIRIPYCIYLCLKYPFLYPRNRFNDKHYNNWKLTKKIENLRKAGSVSVSIIILKDSETIESKIDKMYTGTNNVEITKEISNTIEYNRYKLSVSTSFNRLHIYKEDTLIKTFYLHKLLQSLTGSTMLDANFVIVTKRWNSTLKDTIVKNLYIVISGNHLVPHTYQTCDNYFKIFNFTLELNKFTLFKAKVLEFIHNTILQWIFFIPTYTELDDMPIGWRKAFGIQMCEEIKQELKKHNYLYKYRIMQIKEKFSSLRWYDNGSPNGCIFPIIDKYEKLSSKTCIYCGKPAKYITTGWISPYCEKCIPKNSVYINIK